MCARVSASVCVGGDVDWLTAHVGRRRRRRRLERRAARSHTERVMRNGSLSPLGYWVVWIERIYHTHTREMARC